MGNRSQLCRKLIVAIASVICRGNWGHVAAGVYGVKASTYYRWLEVGGEFRLQVEEADGLMELWERVPEGKATHAQLCGELVVAVQMALCATQGDAVNRLFDKEPEKWLKAGPAREDWKTESKVVIDGQMELGLSVEVECPATIETMAKGIGILQSVNIPTADGRAFRQIGVKPSDAKAEPSNGNGEAGA